MIILTGCLLGLVWVCHDQFENYLEEKTLTTTATIQDNNGKFPNIIFCSYDTFKPNYSKQRDMMENDQQIYDQYTVPINIKVSEKQKSLGGIKPNYTITEIYTKFYGKCRMFHFMGTFESRKYLVFEAWRNESNYLLVIPPGTEIFFNYDWIYTRPIPIQINFDVVVSIQRYLHFTSNPVLFSSFHK